MHIYKALHLYSGQRKAGVLILPQCLLQALNTMKQRKALLLSQSLKYVLLLLLALYTLEMK